VHTSDELRVLQLSSAFRLDFGEDQVTVSLGHFVIEPGEVSQSLGPLGVVEGIRFGGAVAVVQEDLL